MGAVVIPAEIAERYDIHEWRNAPAVLTGAHPGEWADILTVLSDIRLSKGGYRCTAPSDIATRYKTRSPFLRVRAARKGF
jgi:hypothetical protein